MNMFFRRGINEYQRQITLKESFAIQTERLREVFDSIKWTNFEEPPTNRRALRRRFALLLLSPLVEIAWAEGRVTKRERHLIFEAAARMGIKPGTAAHRRLSEWLELHPTEEFYGESLERLNADWKNLPEEERDLRRLDLLSDCVNVAEASGGTKNFPSGGARVCDEEIAAVKYIAQKLNATAGGASIAVAP